MEKRMARRQFMERTGLSAALAASVPPAGGAEPSSGGVQAGRVTNAASGIAPVVEPTPMISGALLADSFQGTHLDPALWSRPNWLVEHNPYIAVAPNNGHLEITGLSRPAGTQHQYVGIISRYFRETDVVLAARLRVQSPFDKPGRIQHHVHLCTGDWPDFFTEVVFGKISSGPPRWFTAYLDRIWVYSGFDEYLEPTLPANGNEASLGHTVVIEHDGATHKTQNYLVVNEEWKPVGPSHRLNFNHSHIELKVDVNAAEAPIHTEFDDVRLYVNPAHHPVTIVVSSRVVKRSPEFPIQNLRVRLEDETSSVLLGEGMTDAGGQARIPLPQTLLYPVAANVQIWNGDQPVLRARIPRYQVQGLYPGDVWAVRIPSTT